MVEQDPDELRQRQYQSVRVTRERRTYTARAE